MNLLLRLSLCAAGALAADLGKLFGRKYQIRTTSTFTVPSLLGPVPVEIFYTYNNDVFLRAPETLLRTRDDQPVALGMFDAYPLSPYKSYELMLGNEHILSLDAGGNAPPQALLLPVERHEARDKGACS